MLIGLDRRLTPDLLYALAAMGHGDQLTIVDAHYPAHAAGRTTPWGACVDFGGSSTEALDAILSVFPIDTFEPQDAAVRAMEQVGSPGRLAEAVLDAQPLLRAAGREICMTERFAFYAQAAKSFVIIRTREIRPYGNFILRKGVIL